MCVIIHKKPKAALDKATLQECWNRNSNGAGFAVKQDGKFIVHKNLMTFDSYYAAIEPYLGEGPDLVTHMRIASRGGIAADLTHPFEVTLSQKNKAVLFHNGTANCVDSLPTGWSDTQFISQMLTGLSFKVAAAILDNLNSADQGRFVLVSEDNLFIKGDKESEEVDGLWFSNLRHKIKPAAVTYLQKNYGHAQQHQHYTPPKKTEQLSIIPKPPFVPTSNGSDYGTISFFVTKIDGTQTNCPSRDDLYSIIAKAYMDINSDDIDAGVSILLEQYKLENIPLRQLIAIAKMSELDEFRNPIEEFFESFH